jgi:magnesium-transporting ATPase (P-type)
VPLTLIFAVSALKEAIDDYYRYKADKAANERLYWVLSPETGGKVQIAAQDIRVGDLIYLRENDEVPCDLVILKTADVDTHCAYIQTANLDGETDLKTRNAVRATATMSEEELLSLRGTLECANPNAEIYKFDSRLKITTAALGTQAEPDVTTPRKSSKKHMELSVAAGRALRVSEDPKWGHRRAASSGRALPLDDESAAPLAPQHPALPRRTVSGQLSSSMTGHRRARSLGGAAALAETAGAAVQDEASPFYIPAHKGGAARAAEVDETGTLTIPLDPSHTAWQATTIRNVAWVVGVVVYTGNETKVGMNKNIPPSKWTKVDMIVNRATIAVFILQIVLTALLGATGNFWLVYNVNRHWYLQEERHTKWYNWFVIPLRFLLLMSLMIPISLKVTLDAVKYIYALLIDWDLDMVDPETGTAANCHSSALSEDLGQIDYIFSDKTGTLTENVMVFAQCSINNVIYDGGAPLPSKDFDNPISLASVNSSALKDNSGDDSDSKGDKKGDKKKKSRPTAATDTRLKALLAGRDPLAYDFCRILALCNTAMPTIDDENCLVWKCASPDEEALVVAAAELGFTLKSSRSDELVLEIDPTGPSYSERTALAREKHQALFSEDEASPAPSGSKSTASEKTASSSHAKDTLSTSPQRKKRAKPVASEDDSPDMTTDPDTLDTNDDSAVATSSSASMTQKLKKLVRLGGLKGTGVGEKRHESPADRVDEEVDGEGESTSAVTAEKKNRKKKRVRIAVVEDETEVLPTAEDDEETDDDDSPKTTERYTVLHILEFTSDRKRMSVLLRSHRTNQLVLLMKGADDKVLAALAPHQHKKDIISDVEHFAQLGLRTLCLCQRVVSESEYAKWSIKLNKAATAMKDREALVADAYAEIEKDFQFVGITAIEDKLQQGVPETIELLRRAGIKIWMLTGDKLATAVQIATSCNLINPTSVLSGEVFTIEGKTFDSALASLNATIAKVLPLTRGMGATNTASSTGVRLNSFFDQPQAYNYQHLALKTAAQTLDEEVVDMERTIGYGQDETDFDDSHAPLVSARRHASQTSSTPRSKSSQDHPISDEILQDLKDAIDGSEKAGKSGKSTMKNNLDRRSMGSKEQMSSSTPRSDDKSPSSGGGLDSDSPKLGSVIVHGLGPTSPRDTVMSDLEDDNSSMASQSSMAVKMTTRRRYHSTGHSMGDHESANGSKYDTDDGSVHVEDTDDEHDVDFQAQQYYQQYHDQQFHRPSINPNTKLMSHRTVGGVATGTGGKRELSLVVEGSTLTHLLRPACKARFLQLALEAHTVICCRVTPQQKAQVVELVKHGVSGVAGGKQERTTLAIGDGGNDVSMIQAASVGVGLMGREGLQAARASDFSLAKFRFLAKLILVHGRWSYRRTAFVAHYCFHKSLFLAFMQIFYAFFTGFAGTSLFDSFALATYNVLFTGLPILFYSLDKDINEQNLLLNPQLYHETQSGRFINTFTLLYWFVRSFAQSALVFFCVIMLGHDRTRNGFPSDWISTSSMAYGACVIVQCFTIFLESNQLTFINHIVIWGTLGLYFVTMLVIDIIIPTFNGVVFGLFADPVFWFGLVLAVSAAILPIIALRFIMITWFPTRSQLVQRMEALSSEDYEAFAKAEQRRRQARASYIQESHEVASLVKKKPPTTNFLMGTIYRFQNAATGRRRNEAPNKPENHAYDSKHPSTLHRTTPATPEVLSEDEGQASPKPRSRTNSTISYGGDTGFDSDGHFTIGRLIGDGSPPHASHGYGGGANGSKLGSPMKPEIIDPKTFLQAAASSSGFGRELAVGEQTVSPPGSQRVTPTRHGRGPKSASVDRTPIRSDAPGSPESPGTPGSGYGYGPKPPRRTRDPTNPAQSTSALMRDPAQFGDEIPSPTTTTGEWAPREGRTGPNPPLSASESNLPFFSGSDGSLAPPGSRRAPFIGQGGSGSSARGSSNALGSSGALGSTGALGTKPRSGSTRKGGIGTSTGSAGVVASSASVGSKVSPIPSLSQRPAYSIEAGHAGTLQVVPLHMLGKKGPLSATATIPATLTDNDWEAQEAKYNSQSASFSQLPAYVAPGEHHAERGSGSIKRARSRSHNPHGGTATAGGSNSAMIASISGSTVLPTPITPNTTPPIITLASSSSKISRTPTSTNSSTSNASPPRSLSPATSEQHSGSQRLDQSETSNRSKSDSPLATSQGSNDSEIQATTSTPAANSLSPSTSRKTKIKISNSSIPND